MMRQGFGFIFKHSTISFVILSMTAGMFAMRCFQLQGFAGRAATTTIHDATETGWVDLGDLPGSGGLRGSGLVERVRLFQPPSIEALAEE
jgi:hypothetical protein